MVCATMYVSMTTSGANGGASARSNSVNASVVSLDMKNTAPTATSTALRGGTRPIRSSAASAIVVTSAL